MKDVGDGAAKESEEEKKGRSHVPPGEEITNYAQYFTVFSDKGSMKQLQEALSVVRQEVRQLRAEYEKQNDETKMRRKELKELEGL